MEITRSPPERLKPPATTNVIRIPIAPSWLVRAARKSGRAPPNIAHIGPAGATSGLLGGGQLDHEVAGLDGIGAAAERGEAGVVAGGHTRERQTERAPELEL